MDKIAARPGGSAVFLGLLVDGDAGVPAPVDEDHEDDAAGEGAEVRHLERVEPGPVRSDRPGMPLANLDQRHAESTSSMTSSMVSNSFWKSADSSMNR